LDVATDLRDRGFGVVAVPATMAKAQAIKSA